MKRDVKAIQWIWNLNYTLHFLAKQERDSNSTCTIATSRPCVVSKAANLVQTDVVHVVFACVDPIMFSWLEMWGKFQA